MHLPKLCQNPKNQRSVENKMRDELKHDKARIQTNKISRFGLLEISRQRLRPSLGESISGVCPRCEGTGRVRDIQSTALSMLRMIEQECNKEKLQSVSIQLPIEVATLLLNEKRNDIRDIETRSECTIVVIPNRYFEIPKFHIERSAQNSGKASYKVVEQPLEEDLEKNNKAGGLLRYGIPDFKMEKTVIDRRIEQIEAEGVIFSYNTTVGIDISMDELKNQFDAVVLSGGSEYPRDLPVEGRDLDGIHFAMDFLPQQNRRVSYEKISSDTQEILASDKDVIVIGGGDTGSDCIGTSIRQGARSVTQLEIMPIPPEQEDKSLTWPNWPLKLRTSSSQSEGAVRDFSVMTQSVSGENGKVTQINCVRVDEKMKPIPKTEFSLKADLILLAMGFVHPIHEGMIESSKADLDPRGNVQANTIDYKTSQDKIFAAGDMRRGQSLVVWAIREGRQCASSVDLFLTGQRNLPI